MRTRKQWFVAISRVKSFQYTNFCDYRWRWPCCCTSSSTLWLQTLCLLSKRRQERIISGKRNTSCLKYAISNANSSIASQNPTPKPRCPLRPGLHRSPEICRPSSRRHLRLLLPETAQRTLSVHHKSNGRNKSTRPEHRCPQFMGHPRRTAKGRTRREVYAGSID